MPTTLVDLLRIRDLARLRAALKANPAPATSPRVIVEAGRLAWRPAFVLLRRYGADLNASWRGYRPLHALLQEDPHKDHGAPSADRLACLDWLLANGADPEQLGAWPPARALLIAAFTGQPAYVDALRKAGAKVDGFVAAALGDEHGVRRSLHADPQFAIARDPGGYTALQCAAASRMASKAIVLIAELLLAYGADLHARTKSWSNEVDALGLAVSSPRPELVELLLRHGALANTALCTALWRNDTEIAAMALRFGANPDEASDDGKPLLNQMVRWGQVRPTLWLLERGANPNLPDDRGWTAVHQAASRGNERMMKALLAAGGYRGLKDSSGLTPLDIARRMRKPKMAALLS